MKSIYTLFAIINCQTLFAQELPTGKCTDPNDPLCSELDLASENKPSPIIKPEAKPLPKTPTAAPNISVAPQVSTVNGKRDSSGRLILEFDDHSVEGKKDEAEHIVNQNVSVESKLCEKEYELANKLREEGSMSKAEKAYEKLFKCYEDSLIEKDDALKLVCKQHGGKRLFSFGMETRKFFVHSESIYFWKQLVYIKGRMNKCEYDTKTRMTCSANLAKIQMDDDQGSVKGLVDVHLTLNFDEDGDLIEDEVILDTLARSGIGGGQHNEGYNCKLTGASIFKRKKLFREAYRKLPLIN